LVAEIDGLKVGEGFSGRVAQSGQPMVVRDITTDPRLTSMTAREEGFRSLASVPLSSKGKVLGTLFAGTRGYREFTDQDVQLLTSIGHQIGVAVENAQLYEQAQQVAVVEERQRLARDLHDAVTQTLFSTSLIAEVVPRLWEKDPDEGRRRLEQVRQGARSALAEMRTLLLELRPAGLAQADLGDLLRQLGEAIAARAHLSVSVEVEGECALSPDVHIALYRIAQEALNNVAKHARASQVTVGLRCQPGQALLTINDDGRGFEMGSVAPGHFGLTIMHERAEAVGATLRVESQPGGGTQITAVWEEDEGRKETSDE
jgi:signal transduction histidine kinase